MIYFWLSVPVVPLCVWNKHEYLPLYLFCFMNRNPELSIICQEILAHNSGGPSTTPINRWNLICLHVRVAYAIGRFRDIWKRGVEYNLGPYSQSIRKATAPVNVAEWLRNLNFRIHKSCGDFASVNVAEYVRKYLRIFTGRPDYP